MNGDNSIIDEIVSRRPNSNMIVVYLTAEGIDEIIETAEYYFDKIKENLYSDKLKYYLFGFTIATTSVKDHLLHHYYVKFFENIIEDRFELMKVKPEKLYIHSSRDPHFDFTKKAKKTGHKIAQNFVKYWDECMNKLWDDEKINFLFTMRNISVHRKIASRPHFITVKEGVQTFGLEWESPEFHHKYSDGIAFCKYCLDKMKAFVTETKSKF